MITQLKKLLYLLLISSAKAKMTSVDFKNKKVAIEKCTDFLQHASNHTGRYLIDVSGPSCKYEFLGVKIYNRGGTHSNKLAAGIVEEVHDGIIFTPQLRMEDDRMVGFVKGEQYNRISSSASFPKYFCNKIGYLDGIQVTTKLDNGLEEFFKLDRDCYKLLIENDSITDEEIKEKKCLMRKSNKNKRSIQEIRLRCSGPTGHEVYMIDDLNDDWYFESSGCCLYFFNLLVLVMLFR